MTPNAESAFDNWILPRRRGRRFLGVLRWGIAWGSVIFLGADMAITAAPTFGKLADLARIRLNDWGDLERRLKVPGAGLEALGPEVGAGVGLLRAVGAESYRLSPAIRGGPVNRDPYPYLTQRIEEAAWPIPFDPASRFVLRRIEESTVCKPLSAANGIAIDHCD